VQKALEKIKEKDLKKKSEKMKNGQTLRKIYPFFEGKNNRILNSLPIRS